jgi:hypothetical protein
MVGAVNKFRDRVQVVGSVEIRLGEKRGCCDLDLHVWVGVNGLYSAHFLASGSCVTQYLTAGRKLLPGDQDCMKWI